MSFCNLSKEELQRLLWCVVLEKDLAHKVGEFKQLGCGSVYFSVTSESFLIDRPSKHHSDSDDRRQPLK